MSTLPSRGQIPDVPFIPLRGVHLVGFDSLGCVVARGWGESCVIGVAAAGQEISTRPFQLVTGRKWSGTAFGGFKSRSEVPPLVDDYEAGRLELDHYITHKFQGIEGTMDAIHALHSGDCLRAVVTY